MSLEPFLARTNLFASTWSILCACISSGNEAGSVAGLRIFSSINRMSKIAGSATKLTQGKNRQMQRFYLFSYLPHSFHHEVIKLPGSKQNIECKFRYFPFWLNFTWLVPSSSTNASSWNRFQVKSATFNHPSEGVKVWISFIVFPLLSLPPAVTTFPLKKATARPPTVSGWAGSCGLLD